MSAAKRWLLWENETRLDWPGFSDQSMWSRAAKFLPAEGGHPTIGHCEMILIPGKSDIFPRDEGALRAGLALSEFCQRESDISLTFR
jgi:hypothetical protein